jgi:hypothetical protein
MMVTLFDACCCCRGPLPPPPPLLPTIDDVNVKVGVETVKLVRVVMLHALSAGVWGIKCAGFEFEMFCFYNVRGWFDSISSERGVVEELLTILKLQLSSEFELFITIFWTLGINRK